METKNKIVRYSERLLQNCSIQCVEHYDDEHRRDGVYVAPQFYLRTCTSFTEKVTFDQAVEICQKQNGKFPTGRELLLLSMLIQKMKYPLSKSGVTFKIPQKAIFGECWEEGDEPKNSEERKYLLLFGYDENSPQPGLPKIEMAGEKHVLIDKVCVLKRVETIWQSCTLQLLLGDDVSNLLVTDDEELFLQKEQKLSYIGKCCAIGNNEVIVCNTGLFQYINGEMRCLLKLDNRLAEFNTSNSGYLEAVYLSDIMPDGEVISVFRTDSWCDDGEQTREEEVEKRFRKDEQGLYQPCK